MSNLHLLLDEANKHDPKGFIPAPFNTFSVKNELGVSFYEERMSLPKAINFVDGTLAPPTTVNNDVYVIIGAGVMAAGWGNATFGDWVKFTNSLPGEIVPLAGYLCYDSTAASWMEYDGAVWATFGGGITNLSEGATTNTTVDVDSSSGANATLAAASTTRAGLMSKAKFDEVVLNNAKISDIDHNATHTSEVTGATALTVQPLAVSNKTLITATAAMELLVNDAGTLKKVVASDFLGGADTNLATNDLTLAAASRFYDVNGNDFQFKDGANNRVRINTNGVAVGNSATPVAGTALFVAGEGATSGTRAFHVENSTGVSFFEFKDNGNILHESGAGGTYHRMRNTDASGWSYFEFKDNADVLKAQIKWYNLAGGYTGRKLGFVSNGEGMYFATLAAKDYKWAIGAQADTTTKMRLLTAGLIVGAAVGAVSPLARIHARETGGGGSAFRADYTSGTARMEFTNAGRLEIDAIAGQDNYITLKSGGSTEYSGFLFYDGATNTGAISSWSSGGAAYLANNMYINSVAGSQVHQAASYYKWALTGGSDALTEMKLDTVGLILGESSGATTVKQRLHLEGRVFMGNQTAPPTPTAGGVIYAEGGALKYIGSSGTITTLGVA